MEKDIKDYLHLYLGCRIIYKQWIAAEDGHIGGEWENHNSILDLKMLYSSFRDYNFSNIELLLRPLSDMTEEEYEHILYDLRSYDGGRDKGKLAFPDMFMTIQNADVFSYCLKQGFDLFGLIESGLAIDKTKQLA